MQDQATVSLFPARIPVADLKSQTAYLSFSAVIHLPFTLPELGPYRSATVRLADDARAVTFRKSSPWLNRNTSSVGTSIPPYPHLWTNVWRKDIPR